MSESIERQVADIINEELRRLDLEAVRLPAVALKATGPGSESGFVVALGRRTNNQEIMNGTFIQRLREGLPLMGEYFWYLKSRLII